jgi:large subunit ribosomal protein L15
MMIHEITAKVGKHKKRKRVGRGIGSGHGKTSGRGQKGAGSRSGYGGTIPATFEGGAMPYFRRIPKRGFSNFHFTNRFSVVNLRALEAAFDNGAEVSAEILVKLGLISDKGLPLKVLGEGELKKKLNVTAAKFSATARQKIEAAGGTANVVA